MKPRMERSVAVLAPHGWLMGGPETDELEQAVRGLIEQGNLALLLDLANVVHMNSTAIGKLVAFHTSYRNRKGRMALCNVDHKIQNILVITKLSLVFDSYPSEREALASFAKVQPVG